MGQSLFRLNIFNYNSITIVKTQTFQRSFRIKSRKCFLAISLISILPAPTVPVRLNVSAESSSIRRRHRNKLFSTSILFFFCSEKKVIRQTNALSRIKKQQMFISISNSVGFNIEFDSFTSFDSATNWRKHRSRKTAKSLRKQPKTFSNKFSTRNY